MPWTVEVSEVFESWWAGLTEEERVSVDGMIRVLERHGPAMGPPYSVDSVGSRHSAMRQLRVPHQGEDLCVLYVPMPARSAVVLLTGTTMATDDRNCPQDAVMLADLIYEGYLEQRGSADGD